MRTMALYMFESRSHLFIIVKRSRTKVNEHVQDMLRRLQELSRYVESGAHVDTQDAVFRIEEKIGERLPLLGESSFLNKGL